MFRFYKDKELSKKQLKTNNIVRETMKISEKDTMYKCVVDNGSNKYISLTDRLISKQFVPENIDKYAKEFSVKGKNCVMSVLHNDTAKYKAYLMAMGKKLKKKYFDITKRCPNLVNMKGNYRNNYNEEFYNLYGDDVLNLYKSKLEDLDFVAMSDFYYSNKGSKKFKSLEF